MRHYPFFVSVKSLFFTCVCILLFLTNATAQIKIGLNGNKIKSSSLLELESLSQGLLLPRLPDTLEINALIPPDGMLVYITKNPNSGLYIRKGGAWVPVQLSSSIKAAKSIKGDGTLNVNNSGDTIILSANSNTSIWNANKLQGYPVSSNIPVTGYLLEWNGSAWIPTAPFRDLNKMTGFINSSQLAAGSVTTEKIPDGAITAAKIGTDYAKDRVLVTDVSGNAIWVDRSSFSTNTLNAGNIFIGNVNGVAIAQSLTGDIGLTTAGVSSIGLSRVTTGMILDGTVGSNDLASGAVLTDKLQSKSVTLAKLADMATSSFIGRNTAGSGTPEVLSVTSTKTMLALNKSDVGLANVENTSDANKIISSATQAALNLKAPINSPTFTGTVTAPAFSGNAATATLSNSVTTNANLTGVVTSIGNATAIANGAISNAMLANAAVANLSGTNSGNQTAATVANVAAGTIAALTVQTALNELDTEKAALASPTFTGTVTLPTGTVAITQTAANNSTAVATTAYADAAAGAAVTGKQNTLTNSAGLAGALNDKTGTGLAVFATSPTLTTPTIGVATATSVNKVAITPPTTGSTLTIADGKTLTASNSLTFTGTDASTLNIGTGGTLGTNAYTSTAFAPLASPTFTGTPTLPTGTIATTQTPLNSTTAVATTAFVTTSDNLKADLASPTFTGTPSLPTGTTGITQSALTSNTTLATTAYADNAAGAAVTGKQNTLTNSAGLAGALNDKTGTGLAVFATSPTLTTPTIGVATATSVNKVAITAPATGSTLTIADGKTLTASNSLTFTGTDASTLNIGTGGTLGTNAFTNTLTGSATLNFGSVTGIGSSLDLTITVTNAALSDNVSLGIPNDSIVPGGIYMAWVSSAGFVTVRVTNVVGGSFDPASGLFKVLVHK